MPSPWLTRTDISLFARASAPGETRAEASLRDCYGRLATSASSRSTRFFRPARSATRPATRS